MKYQTFKEYYSLRQQNEGALGRGIGNVLGAVGPAALGNMAVRGIGSFLDPGNPAYDSMTSVAGIPGTLGGGVAGALGRLPSKTGEFLSNMEDKFYGLFKKKKDDQQAVKADAYVKGLEKQHQQPIVDKFNKIMGHLNILLPQRPKLVELFKRNVDPAKIETHFRAWLADQEISKNSGQLEDATNVAIAALQHAKALGFTHAIQELEVITSALEQAQKYNQRLDAANKEKEPEEAEFEPEKEPESSFKPLNPYAPKKPFRIRTGDKRLDKERDTIDAIREGKPTSEIINMLINAHKEPTERSARSYLTRVRNRHINT